MNQNDQIDFRPKDERRVTLSIPVHKVWNWFKDWRVRKHLESVQEYDEVVRDYRQDQ